MYHSGPCERRQDGTGISDGRISATTRPSGSFRIPRRATRPASSGRRLRAHADTGGPTLPPVTTVPSNCSAGGWTRLLACYAPVPYATRLPTCWRRASGDLRLSTDGLAKLSDWDGRWRRSSIATSCRWRNCSVGPSAANCNCRISSGAGCGTTNTSGACWCRSHCRIRLARS